MGLFIVSAVALAAFGWAETRAKEPIIPTRFFRVPIFATTNAISLLMTIGLFGVMLFLPIYVQGVLGLSAQNSGAVMTPMMALPLLGTTGEAWPFCCGASPRLWQVSRPALPTLSAR